MKISISHIEATQFLLAKGFQYVLSERFMQDVVEDYFGHQRAKGGQSDNLTAQQFSCNDLTRFERQCWRLLREAEMVSSE